MQTTSPAPTTPIPTVNITIPGELPVHVINNQATWTTFNVITLSIALLSLFISGLAYSSQRKSWKYEGPVLETEFELVEKLGITVTFINTGRMPARIAAPILTTGNNYDWCLLPLSGCYDGEKYDWSKTIEPGEVRGFNLYTDDFATLLMNSEVGIHQIQFRTHFAGKDMEIKLPQNMLDALLPFIESEIEELKSKVDKGTKPAG